MELLFLLVLLGVVSSQWTIRHHLGTQSPYWSENSTTPSPAPEGCSPIHLNLLSRHGVRFPTKGDISSLTELAGLVQQYNKYIPDSFAYIKNWTNPYPVTQQGFLAFSGEEELFLMGQRYNNTYYPVLSQQYFPDVYVMQSTQVPRTGASASSFAQGYLQGTGKIGPSGYQPTYIFSDTPSLDILRFFDNCPRYTLAMDDGTINADQADIYANEKYPSIASRVAQTLGVSGEWDITVDQLDWMFTACAFEISVFNKTDGWCALFMEEDILVYEYASDLEEYWEKSYGSGIGYQISAVVLQQIVSVMEGVMAQASGYQNQKAYLRFAHAEDIIPMAALLGLFKDDYPLTANTSQGQIQNRNWTTSVISPFGANFAFALYNCSGEYRVKLTHNEVEYQFPGCSDIYCPYTEFKSLYAKALALNFTETCALPQKGNSEPTKTVSVTFFSVGIILSFVGGAFIILFGLYVYYRKRQEMWKYSPFRDSSES